MLPKLIDSHVWGCITICCGTALCVQFCGLKLQEMMRMIMEEVIDPSSLWYRILYSAQKKGRIGLCKFCLPSSSNLFVLVCNVNPPKDTIHKLRPFSIRVRGCSQFTLTKIALFFTPYPPLVDMR